MNITASSMNSGQSMEYWQLGTANQWQWPPAMEIIIGTPHRQAVEVRAWNLKRWRSSSSTWRKRSASTMDQRWFRMVDRGSWREKTTQWSRSCTTRTWMPVILLLSTIHRMSLRLGILAWARITFSQAMSFTKVSSWWRTNIWFSHLSDESVILDPVLTSHRPQYLYTPISMGQSIYESAAPGSVPSPPGQHRFHPNQPYYHQFDSYTVSTKKVLSIYGNLIIRIPACCGRTRTITTRLPTHMDNDPIRIWRARDNDTHIYPRQSCHQVFALWLAVCTTLQAGQQWKYNLQ